MRPRAHDPTATAVTNNPNSTSATTLFDIDPTTGCNPNPTCSGHGNTPGANVHGISSA